jgi:hypothetical protein
MVSYGLKEEVQMPEKEWNKELVNSLEDKKDLNYSLSLNKRIIELRESAALILEEVDKLVMVRAGFMCQVERGDLITLFHPRDEWRSNSKDREEVWVVLGVKSIWSEPFFAINVRRIKKGGKLGDQFGSINSYDFGRVTEVQKLAGLDYIAQVEEEHERRKREQKERWERFDSSRGDAD